MSQCSISNQVTFSCVALDIKIFSAYKQKPEETRFRNKTLPCHKTSN